MSIVLVVAAGIYLAQYLQAPLAEFLAVGLAGQEGQSLWPIAKTVMQFLASCALAGAVPGWRAATRDPAAVLRTPCPHALFFGRAGGLP